MQEALKELHAVRQRASRAEAATKAVLAEVAAGQGGQRIAPRVGFLRSDLVGRAQ